MAILIIFLIYLLQSQSDRLSQMPDHLLQMIIKEYPKSELVQCSYDKPRQNLPSSFIQGDFNGDSKTDFAAIVKINAPAPNCYCFVFISTDSQYVMKVLTEPYMYCSPNKRLSLDKKGSKKYDYGTDSETTLINDAFTIYLEVCNTYIYENADFRILHSCD